MSAILGYSWFNLILFIKTMSIVYDSSAKKKPANNSEVAGYPSGYV